jgi:hypothetical protein
LRRSLKKFFAFFGAGEVIFLLGMILLFSGVSVLLSPAWAQSACGIILVGVGLATAWRSQ